jgi:hypothetical protein
MKNLSVLIVVFVLASAHRMLASHMVYDPATKRWKEVPDATPPPSEKANSAKRKQTPSDKPKPEKTKSTLHEQETTPNSANVLVGLWIATNNQVIGGDKHMIGKYEIAIREGGTAIKTLYVINNGSFEVFNDSSGKTLSYQEIERKWLCKSSWVRTAGGTITIDWSKGELIDWSPRTISRDDIQTYGSPNPETSVYQLTGDELRRVNDPNGLTYRRMR